MTNFFMAEARLSLSERSGNAMKCEHIAASRVNSMIHSRIYTISTFIWAHIYFYIYFYIYASVYLSTPLDHWIIGSTHQCLYLVHEKFCSPPCPRLPPKLELTGSNPYVIITTSLEIIVSKGNHPQMTLIQISEIL